MATWNPVKSEEVEVEEVPRGSEEEGASSTGERPRKRRRVDDKYKVFTEVEKTLLKKYDDLVTKTRKIIDSTYGKLFTALTQGVMPEGINYLKQRLDALRKKTSLVSIHIGFLGATGAGKSSLINAILGKQLFLPVSCYSTCTSCTVYVKRSTSNLYEATVNLLTDAEWRDELNKCVAILSRTDGDDNDDAEEEDDGFEEASLTLCTIYGEGASNKTSEELLRMRVPHLNRKKIELKEEEEEEFSKKLGSYVRVRKEGSVAEGSDVLWPLVKKVEVNVPGLDMLPDGITLVDIPGTGDFNNKRDEMWKESIASCSVLWIISDIGRAFGEKVQGLLLKESITACVGGNCTDIALVATKSDILDFNTYTRERGNREPAIENEHDAILERNEDVKERKGKSIKEKLKKRLPPDSEIIHKPNLVYTVSAKEFFQQRHLNEEETEIPKLRKYIREIYLKEKEKVVTEYVTDAYSIHQLAENFGSERLLVEQCFQESGVEEFVNNEIDTLNQNLERCFNELDQHLNDGVEYAKRTYRTVVNNFLTKENGYRGFHKTLKAVCLKNGVYASKTFARINFNEALATPIYNKIEGHFGTIFRIQHPTRQSLLPRLEAFVKKVNEKIKEIGKRHNLPNNKTEMCTRENEVILTKLKKEILNRKKVIYDTLPLSIQNNLMPCYEAASNVKGAKACDRMKEILRENVKKEVENKMFEKAVTKMKNSFLELKEVIVKMLKEDVSIVLKLVLLQQNQLAMRLPDIERECRDMERLFNSLQTMKSQRNP